MPTLPTPNVVSIFALPPQQIVNFPITVESNTTLSVGYGQCWDSSGRDEILFSADQNNPYASSGEITINAANTGINGLDTGSLDANKCYAVYVIGDSTNQNPTAFLLALATANPVMPTGRNGGAYNMARLIGYEFTDGSSHFLPRYIFGTKDVRRYQFDAPQSVLSSGTSTSFADVTLTTVVVPLAVPVEFLASFTPNAAADVATFRTKGSAGTGFPFASGAVSTKAETSVFTLMSGLDSGAPKIQYKVATSGSLNLSVVGFNYQL